jgi:predicted dehydrogenase
MVAACDRAGVTFMVAENERYKSNFRSVGRAIRSGLVGEMLAIRSEMYGRGDRVDEPNHWLHDPERSGGGIVISLAVHRLDVMRWLGGPPRSVSAAFELVEGEKPIIERVASVQLRFASGAIGHFLSAEVTAPPPKSGALLVLGTRGTIGVLMPGFGYQGPALLFSSKAAEPTPLPLDRDGLASDDAFDAEVLHFASCIETGLEPHTSGRDNLQTMRLVFAVYESARTGRTVELPMPTTYTNGPSV